MVMLHPAGTEHSDRFGQTGGTCLNLEWDPSWLADSETGLDRLSHSSYVDVPDIAWLTRRLRAEVLASGAYSDAAIHGLSRALVAGIAREAYDSGEASGPGWVREAVALIEHEFAHGPGLTEVAAHVGVHPTHLARVFRERLGTSVGELVRQRRVEAAARLLVSSDRSLSEIGYETGFADQSHFTRTFRRHVGMTPGEYRRSRGSR